MMGNLPHTVVLMPACLLVLFAHSALPAEPSVTFSALQFDPPTGGTAEFVCRVSNVNVSNYSIYWYKISEDNVPKKLDISSGNRRKYDITQRDSWTYELKILSLQKNDSGVYYCGLISFSLNRKLTESMKRNLTVTDKRLNSGPLEEETEAESGEEEGKDEEIRHMTLLPAIGGSGVVLVMACLCIFLAYILRRRREHRKSQDENAPLEEEVPSTMSVFTVDYGVLEFHAGGNPGKTPPPPPPKRSPSDRTEYATILFSQGKLVTDDGGKRTPKLGKFAGGAQAHGRGQGHEPK